MTTRLALGLVLCLVVPCKAQYIPTPVDSWAEVGTELNRVALRMQKQSLLNGGTVYGDLAIQERLETADTYTDTLSVRQMYGKGASGITISSPTTTSSSATFTATGATASLEVSSAIALGNISGPSGNGSMSYAQTGNILYISSLSVVMGAWKTWTPTFAGFSADPTGVIARYSLVGKLCAVSVIITGNGTSNATTFTMTLPVAAANTGAQVGMILAVDNSSGLTSPGVIATRAASTTADLYTTLTGTGWTGSGGKRAQFQFVYETQ